LSISHRDFASSRDALDLAQSREGRDETMIPDLAVYASMIYNYDRPGSREADIIIMLILVLYSDGVTTCVNGKHR
jgi:hypothetical protein